MTEPEYMDGTASGTLHPGLERPVTIRVLWDEEGVGATDEEALLLTLQSAGLVSDDVRAVFTDGAVDLEGGATLLTVMDVDTDGAVAWVRIPWMADGSSGDLAALMREYGGDASAVSADLARIGERLARRDEDES